MAYVVWRVLMKKYSKVRLGIHRTPNAPVSSTLIIDRIGIYYIVNLCPVVQGVAIEFIGRSLLFFFDPPYIACDFFFYTAYL